jgi:hypothetical protein
MVSGRNDPAGSTESSTHTREDWDFQSNLAEYFGASKGSHYEKLAAFTKYVPRQFLTSFLARTEIFNKR